MNDVPRRIRAPIMAVLLVALVVRLWGIGFGLPFANARPDETGIAGPAVGFLAGDLRPPNFFYPTLFMYAVSGAYVAYFAVTSPFAPYSTLAEFAESRRQNLAPFLYLSRTLSVLMGVLTVWWIYRLARRVADESTALLAAAFLAVSFLHVRDSHFGVTDVTMTALVVLAVLQIAAWRQSGAWGRAGAAGLAGGLAMSTKYNGLGVAVPFAVAALQRLTETRPVLSMFRESSAAATLFGLVFAAAFFGGSPYILIEWPRFVQDVTAQGAVLTLGHGVAMARGWWHHAVVTLPAAVGWPLYLAGMIGAAGLLLTEFRRSAVVLAFPIAYYVVAGNGYTVFARYMLPVLPFLCLAAAWAVVTMVRAVWPDSRGLRTQHALIAAMGFVVAAPSTQKVVQLDRLLSRADNRVIVADAIGTLVPARSSLYHSGASYAHVQLPPALSLREFGYDASSVTFFGGEGPPDWILLQRSPLTLYSDVPASLEQVVRNQYSFVRSFPVGDDRRRLYDQQDAFFLPLTGFSGLTRPGPSFELYKRRGL